MIHNSHVISELENLGIETICEPEQNACGICIIRSHGESIDVFNKVQSCGYELVDLTCFDVKKVQQKAMEMAKEGFFVSIPDPILCTDNAAMIGSAAYYEYIKGIRDDLTLNANPSLKLGER